MRTIREIAWLAGLLEGEGCFRAQRHTPSISLDMTDGDVVARAADILGVPGAQRHYPKRSPERKSVWTVNVHGAHAAAWMMTLYTFLGARRRAKVTELIKNWTAHRGPQFSTKGLKRMAVCHPEKPSHARGLCKQCYPIERAKDPVWLAKRRAYEKQYYEARRKPPEERGLRRNNRYLEFKGERLTVTEWARRLGVRSGMLWVRLYKGWSTEDILSRPARVRQSR